MDAKRPSWVYLVNKYVPQINYFNNNMSRKEAEYKAGQILELLCTQDLDVQYTDKSGHNWADHLLVYSYNSSHSPQNLLNRAKVFVAFIHDRAEAGLSPYEINYHGIFAGLGHKARIPKMREIKEVVGEIQKILRNPQSEKEQLLVRNYPEITRAWMNHVHPDPADLPLPSAEFIESVSRIEDLTKRLVQTPDLSRAETDILLQQAEFLQNDCQDDLFFKGMSDRTFDY